MIYSKEEINTYLSRAYFGVLSYATEEGRVTSQLMIYGHTIDGVIYLSSRNDKSVFLPLTQGGVSVGVLIYKEEEDLEDIRQICIEGRGELMSYDSEDIGVAEDVFGEKSPLIQSSIKERDTRLVLVRVEVLKLSTISFEEINEAVSPIVLKRV